MLFEPGGFLRTKCRWTHTGITEVAARSLLGIPNQPIQLLIHFADFPPKLLNVFHQFVHDARYFFISLVFVAAFDFAFHPFGLHSKFMSHLAESDTGQAFGRFVQGMNTFEVFAVSVVVIFVFTMLVMLRSVVHFSVFPFVMLVAPVSLAMLIVFSVFVTI